MSKRSNPAWRWCRFISREAEPLWISRTEILGGTNWLLIEKPQRVKLRLEVYFSKREEAAALVPVWGGKVEAAPLINPTQKFGPPIRVNAKLEIVHEIKKGTESREQLYIPYGMAFGSGEHSTTLMLIRALAGWKDWSGVPFLDLGTGSGVLALTARKLGAQSITATDFDPDSIRTATKNEKLNFMKSLVHWKCADVKKLGTSQIYSLIVANLFSGILGEAAKRIVRALRPAGQLWLSGILKAQQEEVAGVYRREGLHLLKTTTRGKWVMQQWKK